MKPFWLLLALAATFSNARADAVPDNLTCPSTHVLKTIKGTARCVAKKPHKCPKTTPTCNELNPSAADATKPSFEVPADAPGYAVAELHGCFDCHTLDGTPARAPSWRGLYGSQRAKSDKDPTLVAVDESWLKERILGVSAKFKLPFHGQWQGQKMAGETLNPDELEDVIDFIKLLK
jgi:hypothetical protein